MKKFLLILLSVLLCGLCLAGCKKEEVKEEEIPENDPMIIGTWMEDYWDSGYSFAEDGTGKDIFWDQDLTFTALEGNLTLTYTDGLWADKVFTYTINGDVLTLTEVLPEGAEGTPGVWDYTKR